MNDIRVVSRPWTRGGVLALALLAGACGGGEAGQTASADAAENVVVLGPQDVATATRSELGAGVVLSGSLKPYREADVKAQVPGTVSGMRAREGSPVADGQVMATIEAQGIRSQASGAQAGVAAARANLAQARRQLESSRMLYEAGAQSEIEFRGAQAAFEAAEAQVAAARAQAATTGEAASKTVVRAPFAGEVSARAVEEGEAVNPGQTLFTVVNTQFLELAGRVGVDQVMQVRQGQPVEFTLTGFPGRTFQGEVSRVEPTADPTTRQVGVYVRLPNPGRQLVGGVFATGRVKTGGGGSALVVPAGAVRGSGAGTYAWVVQNGVVVRRPVVVGARDESRGVVEVSSGIRAGEQVVVSPAEPREGARVRTTRANPANAPASEEG